MSLLPLTETRKSQVFGIVASKATDNRYQNNRSMRYNFYSKPVAEYLRVICYAPDGHKILPKWALTLPNQLLWPLMHGLWNGDGYRSQQKYSLTNVSPYLIGQTQVILHKLGVMTKLCRDHKERSTLVNGKAVHGRGRFALDVYGESLLRLAAHIGAPQHESLDRQFTSQQGYREGHIMWRPIRKVETVPYDGIVYNIETADHSYTTMAGCVHNCDAIPYSDLMDFLYRLKNSGKLTQTPRMLPSASAWPFP